MRMRIGTVGAMLMAVVLALNSGGCGSIAPGADPVVVTGQRSLSASVETINAFLTFDRQNVTLMKAQFADVHAFAESLRKRLADPATDPIGMAQAALKLYQATRTTANGDALTKAMAVVEAIATDARTYLVRVSPAATNHATGPPK